MFENPSLITRIAVGKLVSGVGWYGLEDWAPSLDPIFQAFHSHFLNVLTQSHTIVFVGFAFRDEHINELCERYIHNRTRVVVIDPSQELRLPFRDVSTTRILERFDKNTATSAAKVMLGEEGP